MHRLQISLPDSQHQYLVNRSRREGVSIAELIRRIVDREARAVAEREVNSVWEIAGIAEDRGILIGGIAVSERPEMYLTTDSLPRARRKRSRQHREKRKR